MTQRSSARLCSQGATSYLAAAAALALGLLAGCGADASDDSAPAELQESQGAITIDLQVSPDHVHAFQSVATFSVTAVRDGLPYRELQSPRVELGVAGSDEWTQGVALLLDGDVYTASTVLAGSGEFDVRAVGTLADDEAEPSELGRRPEPLRVVRPHFDAGGYRVEFGTASGAFPVATQPATVRFFVMEDVAPPRPPVTGLEGLQIVCTQESDRELHAVVEPEPGTYEASHTFDERGAATATLEFIGLDGETAVAQMSLPVSAAP